MERDPEEGKKRESKVLVFNAYSAVILTSR